ncbi:hypothetical protein LOC71_10570 [Rhodopirellula sp. JC740]|uniref:Uncharacterized protein n=2 Tax=Rhodopirellula halodulae TaxID=2894198 RepID=A0ABS8NGP8_9BACT|nr:hypothetical protein [Rhodopirellula sp. JC740]
MLAIIAGVSAAGVFSQLGIVRSSLVLKVLAVGAFYASTCYSISVIYRNRERLSAYGVLLFVSVASVYPVASSVVQFIEVGTFRAATDLLFVHGGYYQLPVNAIALGMVARVSGNGVDALRRYASFSVPVGALVVAVLSMGSAEGSIGIAHVVMDNFFVPSSLLACVAIGKGGVLIGAVGVFMMLITSSLIWSRSYSIVSLVLLLGSLQCQLASSKGGGRGATILFVAVFAVVFGVVGSFAVTSSSLVQESSLQEKWGLDSLSKAFGLAVEQGSVVPLWEWEGNSRRGIIDDAFSGFTTRDWLLGKGLLAEYDSFVARSTIEIGVAQELFRWGALYVLSNLFLTVFSIARLMRIRRHSDWLKILFVVLVARFVDSMFFGLPRISVYSLLAFTSVSAVVCLREESSEKVGLA